MCETERYRLAVEKLLIRAIQSEIVFGELHTQDEIMEMLENKVNELKDKMDKSGEDNE